MTETNGSTGTLTRSVKHSDAFHPHYFTSFQNYCCGPKSKGALLPMNKDLLPIPDIFKSKAERMVTVLNQDLIERTQQIVQFTSSIPREFFESTVAPDIQRYLVDRMMLKTMNDAHVINWMPSLKKIYPVRTSGSRNHEKQCVTCSLSCVRSRQWQLSAPCGAHRLDWCA